MELHVTVSAGSCLRLDKPRTKLLSSLKQAYSQNIYPIPMALPKGLSEYRVVIHLDRANNA